eukprot:scaffold1454_cov342-Pavlova_lutheri.AAC.16
MARFSTDQGRGYTRLVRTDSWERRGDGESELIVRVARKPSESSPSMKRFGAFLQYMQQIYGMHVPQMKWQKGGSRHKKMDNPGHFDVQSDEEEEFDVLGSIFDLTQFRVRMIFTALYEREAVENETDDGDVDIEGKTIKYSTFREGLDQLGLDIKDENFMEILKNIDKDASGDINLHEFERAIKEVQMSVLFRPDLVSHWRSSFVSTSKLSSIDYNANFHHYQPHLASDTDMKGWIQRKRPSWTNVRWIHLDGRDPLILQRLAVKYKLHPLSLEDAMENTRAKVHRFDGYYFISCPVIKVVKHVDSSRILELHEIYPSRDVTAIFHGQASFFVKNDYSLVISVITTSDELSADYLDDFFMDIREKLLSPTSLLRQYDGSYLLYELLDKIVDRIVDVKNVFGTVINELRMELRHSKLTFDIHELEPFQEQIMELLHLLRPMQRMLHLCVQDKSIVSSDCALYLHDAQDHLEMCIEELAANISVIQSLRSERKRMREEHMDNNMFIFTLITVVFLPAQFVTGVYGMNFHFMPELSWKQSYFVFWVLILCYFFSAFTLIPRLQSRVQKMAKMPALRKLV